VIEDHCHYEVAEILAMAPLGAQQLTSKVTECDISNNIIPKKIKHIVISGGGTTGFSFYGILRESNKKQLWNIKDIESIYGTSVGTILAVVLCLNFEWDILDKYFIERPWQKIFNFDIYSILRVFEKRGIFSISLFEEMLQPLFLAADIPMNVTLQKFYDITKIELHIFVTEINRFETIDVSYKTHPEWQLIQTIYASSTIPIIFEPWSFENKMYIDGGILMNYPVSHCILNGADPDEIFGLNKIHNSIRENIKEESSFFDYIILIINRILEMILNQKKNEYIVNEINITSHPVNIQEILHTASSMQEREHLINIGVESFQNYYNKNKDKDKKI
jgi:predicted acylesterase/phospholipase RssA